MHEAELGIGIFLFPKEKQSLIHDHPGAVVITKILEGAMRI